MNTQAKRMAGDALYNTIGTFAYFFCQWLTTLLVVRLADFESAGDFSLMISFTNCFAFITLYGVRGFQITDVRKQFTDGQYIAHRMLTSCVALVPFLLLLPLLYGDHPTFMACACAYMLFKYLECTTDVLFGVMQRALRYDWIMVSYLLKGLLPVLGFALTLWLKAGLLAAIGVMTVSYGAVVLLYDLPRLNESCDLKPSFSGLKPIFTACFPLMLYSLISPYMTYLTRSVIGERLGATELGYYASVSMVVVVMTTLGGSIWGVLIPKISELYRERKTGDIARLLVKILLACVGVGVLAVLAAGAFGEWALVLLFKEPIRSYAGLLGPVLITSVLLTISSLLSSILTAMRCTRALLMANLAGATACTLCVSPLTAAQGMAGANESLMLGFGVQIVLLGCLVGRRLTTQSRSSHE